MSWAAMRTGLRRSMASLFFTRYPQYVPVPDVRCELNKIARADCKTTRASHLHNFHSPVERSVEKQENAENAFDKQKSFNGLHLRPHARWKLEIALKSGIDKNEATV